MNQERNGHRSEGVSPADREQWVRRYREGNLGLKRFAERHGLRPAQLHYWIYGARRPAAPERTPTSAAVTTPVFREVLLPRQQAAEWAAQITWPDGLSLRVAHEADPARIAALIEHLRCSCSR